MDYSLVQMKMEMRKRQITVLILVVMDYSLVQRFNYEKLEL